jgi:hypothetical protein
MGGSIGQLARLGLRHSAAKLGDMRVLQWRDLQLTDRSG